MNNPDKAKMMLKDGFSCSQAVLVTFAEKFNLDRNAALKLADGFGAGMGRMALTCGAVTGAFMVIGLKYGRTEAKDNAAKQKTMQLVREFTKRFENRNKTTICKELLNCDISTDEGFKYATERKLQSTLCPEFVMSAAEILEEIL